MHSFVFLPHSLAFSLFLITLSLITPMVMINSNYVYIEIEWMQARCNTWQRLLLLSVF